jgi:hypothetical protein
MASGVTAPSVVAAFADLKPLVFGIVKHDKPYPVGLHHPHEFMHFGATRDPVEARNDDLPNAALAAVDQPL